ncbi:uncharacterized protein N7458_012508 [Penicillium daleae]|uniref:Uncharacterized protein n=1 Tax=Penicillium daleae TaxID=63821 RepID=A0AAD6FXW8_9EURO|nr:uncharacterized protein N7458_012508 [Penicillium daleae]KAJ5433352.1 hypothetical protein N7458_012508 [Penicillium daleae]
MNTPRKHASVLLQRLSASMIPKMMSAPQLEIKIKQIRNFLYLYILQGMKPRAVMAKTSIKTSPPAATVQEAKGVKANLPRLNQKRRPDNILLKHSRLCNTPVAKLKIARTTWTPRNFPKVTLRRVKTMTASLPIPNMMIERTQSRWSNSQSGDQEIADTQQQDDCDDGDDEDDSSVDTASDFSDRPQGIKRWITHHVQETDPVEPTELWPPDLSAWESKIASCDEGSYPFQCMIRVRWEPRFPWLGQSPESIRNRISSEILPNNVSIEEIRPRLNQQEIDVFLDSALDRSNLIVNSGLGFWTS